MRATPISPPRWRGLSGILSSFTTSAIPQGRSKSRAGGCTGRMSGGGRRRLRKRPGENVGGGDPPHPKGTEHRLHHAMRSGDQMYAGCWASGVAIIDVSDIGQPCTLSHYQYDPPRPEPTHTFLKVPFPINGRTIAVSTEEERPQRGPDAEKPHAAFRTWDVTDPTK